MTETVPDAAHEVRIVDFPLDVYRRTDEAFEGLRREFTLMALATDGADIPSRLLRLVDVLSERYDGLSDEVDRIRDEALARGDHVVPELVYRVPVGIDEACVALSRILDDADEFCRHGHYLLSLATPPEAVAFRRWYLGEFVAQPKGEPPLPWSQVDQAALVEQPLLRGEAPVQRP